MFENQRYCTKGINNRKCSITDADNYLGAYRFNEDIRKGLFAGVQAHGRKQNAAHSSFAGTAAV